MSAVKDHVTLPELGRMKAEGRKIVGVVAWDCQTAQIADRSGVDIVSVGDSVGVQLWGRRSPLEVSLDEMVLVAQAVRNGVERALVSCDLPFGRLQEGGRRAVRAVLRLVSEAGADLVKLDDAAFFPDVVEAVAHTGVPVFAQLGITPQSAARYGVAAETVMSQAVQVPSAMVDELVAQAKQLESAGASLLDFTNSGPVAGPAVVNAVRIPVLGGLGGGPWLDGRIRLVSRAAGSAAANLDQPADAYANVARILFDAVSAYRDDVLSARPVKGDGPTP